MPSTFYYTIVTQPPDTGITDTLAPGNDCAQGFSMSSLTNLALTSINTTMAGLRFEYCVLCNGNFLYCDDRL
ncbi:hypothetical protein PoB_007524900 [Plakobranchus ocellatus]|uniref:Uncharacterized protein n=1 Tax=Plakobranchus ocellatus TaxID=259542 RepID=A0AAV4DX01_9GAST|nr:hypothetical protein PoB_007524900 [Plakobranchus ocellatus]